MNKQDALAALLSAQAKPKVVLPPTPSAPSQAGYCGSLGDRTISRVGDRVRAAAAQREVIPQQAKSPAQVEHERLMKVYEDDYNQRQAAEKADEVRRRNAADEKRHVAACHEASRLRDKADADARAQKVVEQMFSDEARRRVKHILSDCTGEEIQEILQRVDAAKMKGFALAYQAFKDEVRAGK